MAPKPQDQTALDEREVNDRELQKTLEDRERAKGVKSEASKKFKTLDDVTKGLIEKHGLKPDEPVRCGRFRISKSERKGQAVSFETSPSSRLSITPIKND